MNKIKSALSSEWIVVLCCIAVFAGLVSSRALISIGMISLAVAMIVINGPKKLLFNYITKPALYLLSIPFVMVALSGLWSANTEEWLAAARIKLPFFILPLAFVGLPRLKPIHLHTIIYGFTIAIGSSTFIILANYFFHYDAINQSFLSGSGIPVPFSHIRHTLMLAFSVFTTVYMLENISYVRSRYEKWLQISYIIFAVIALHILSVRSGLLALYLGAIVYVIHFIINKKKYAFGVVMLSIAVLLPLISYELLPSLRNKVKYMIYDIEQFKNGKFADTNDGVRLVSLQIGLEVWQQNKWLGSGAGDLKAECMKLYDKHFPGLNEFSRKLPHNQFVWIMASIGIVGLIGFLTAMLSYIGDLRFHPDKLFATFHLIIWSSLFFEHTLEEQIGTAFFLVFHLLLLNHLTYPKISA